MGIAAQRMEDEQKTSGEEILHYRYHPVRDHQWLWSALHSRSAGSRPSKAGVSAVPLPSLPNANSFNAQLFHFPSQLQLS